MRGAREHHDEAFASYVAARQNQLRRIAYAVCGDWNRADDVLQTALTRLYIAWPRLRNNVTPDAYVRRIIIRADIDDRRRLFRRKERPGLDGHDPTDAVSLDPADRDELMTAVHGLPTMQRKTILLRYWLRLSVSETASELGISEGTVKSHSSRALTKLQSLLTSAATE